MSVETVNRVNKRFFFNPEVAYRRRFKKQSVSQITAVEEKETTREKEIKEKVAVFTPTYTCPLTNVDFKGGCPIIPCHANITNYTPRASCCLYLETEKSEFDKWDLQQFLDIKESRLYKNREQGEKKVTAIVILNKLLSFLRENCTLEQPVKNTPEIVNFVNRSYLSLKELNTRLSDVGLITQNLDTVKQFVADIDSSITISDLFGTEETLPGAQNAEQL